MKFTSNFLAQSYMTRVECLIENSCNSQADAKYITFLKNRKKMINLSSVLEEYI